jgi:hypothetical protein
MQHITMLSIIAAAMTTTVPSQATVITGNSRTIMEGMRPVAKPRAHSIRC